MKKLFFIVCLLCSFVLSAQIRDTTTLRVRVNSDIVPNNNGTITATKINNIFNGFLNAFGPLFAGKVDSVWSNGSHLYFKRNGVTYNYNISQALDTLAGDLRYAQLVNLSNLSGYHKSSYYDSVFLGLYAQSGYNKANWDAAYNFISTFGIGNYYTTLDGRYFKLSDTAAALTNYRIAIYTNTNAISTHLSLINSLISDSAYQAAQIAAHTTAIASKEPAISTGSTNYFWSWDKTWRQISYSQISSTPDLSVYETLAHKGAASGYAPLGSDSKIPTSYMPSLALNNVWPVSSQSAMLALLSAVVGDVAIRSDSSLTYVLKASDYSHAYNWVQLLFPTAPVLSVAGMTGNVTLTTSNVSEGTNLYYTSSRFTTDFNAKNTGNLSEGSNLYYTDTRARAAHSFTAGSGAYNSTTGVITIPTNNNQIGNGSNYITLTSLSSTATGLTYTNTTGVFSLTSGYAIPTTTQISNWNALVAMTYPAAGIAVSTGSAWGTSITDNSTNWNTAYSSRLTTVSATNISGSYLGNTLTLSLSGTNVTNALGFTPYNSTNPSGYISLTSLSFAAGSGAYNNSTGVITIPTNTNQLTNGAGFITTGTISGVSLGSNLATHSFDATLTNSSGASSYNGSAASTWGINLANANTWTNSTQSTSYTTGSVIFQGGIGVSKDIFTNGNINISGQIVVGGGGTYLASNILRLGSSGLQINGSGTSLIYGYNSGTTEHDFQVGGTIIGKFTSSGFTLPALSTKGIVTNTAAGLLGTTTGTGFMKQDGAGNVSYDNSTYLTTSAAASTYSPIAGSSSIVTVGTLSSGSIPYSLLSGGTSLQLVAANGTIQTLDNTSTASTIVQRNSASDIFARYFNSSASVDDGQTLTTIAGFAGSGYIRNFSLTATKTWLGLGSMAYASTGSYLPLTGGSLSGALSGTSASFSGNLNSKGTSGDTWVYQGFKHGSSTTIGGLYEMTDGSGSIPLYKFDGTQTITLNGSTGAATFGSTLHAGDNQSGVHTNIVTQDASGYGVGLGYSSGNYGYISSQGATPLHLQINGVDAISIDATKAVSMSSTLSVTGYLTASGGAGTSDIRLKTNIVYNPSISILDSIDFIQYNMKDNLSRLRYGVIAQNIEHFLPDLVLTNDKGIKAVMYDDLQNIEIHELYIRLKKLEKQVSDLENAKK